MNEERIQHLATGIVDDIIRDLTDRRGLKHEWYQIDDDIIEEIVTTWRGIVAARLREEAGE